jgi:hypothetical protein
MTGDGLSGAIEWNLGRSWRWSHADRRVPSPLRARILTALFGAWVGARSPGCRPLQGKHPDDCPHRRNLVPVRLGPFSEGVLGNSGGSQTRQVERSITEFAERSVDYRPYAAGFLRRSLRRSATLLSITSLPDHLAETLRDDGLNRRPDLVVSFDAEIVESLLKGHYQRVPLGLVQGLTRADYLVWLTTLCQVPVGQLYPGGDPAVFTVTGADPPIERWQLGMGSLSPRELLDSIGRAAEAGNGLQRDYVMEVDTVPPKAGRLRSRVAIHMTRPEKTAVEGANPAPDVTNFGTRTPERELSKDVDKTVLQRLDRATSSQTYGSTIRGTVGGGASIVGRAVHTCGRRTSVSWASRSQKPWRGSTQR